MALTFQIKYIRQNEYVKRICEIHKIRQIIFFIKKDNFFFTFYDKLNLYKLNEQKLSDCYKSK